MGYLCNEGWDIYLPYSSFKLRADVCLVTHWMELPELPEFPDLPEFPMTSIPEFKKTQKHKKSAVELIDIFWNSSMEAFFNQETVAPVISKSKKTLECDRWRGAGIPYRKIGGRILYRKSDVLNYLERHELVRSTSERDEHDKED